MILKKKDWRIKYKSGRKLVWYIGSTTHEGIIKKVVYDKFIEYITVIIDDEFNSFITINKSYDKNYYDIKD